MEKSFRMHNVLERLLAKTGGWYLIIVAFFAQVVASFTTLLSFRFERLNAEYSVEQNTLLSHVEIAVIPTLIVTLTTTVIILTRSIRNRLDTWKHGPERFNKDDDLAAWKSAQNYLWKYAIAAAIIFLGVVITPKTYILIRSGLATRDQIIYSLIASLISILAFVPFSTILQDSFLVPIRQMLLPTDFSQQLLGLNRFRIIYKFLAVIFISLLITAFLIAPIGYHQTTRVLYREIGSFTVLSELQLQSFLVSGFAILFAISLAFLLSRSITNPLQKLLEAFQKVEGGDLNARMPVISSDEVSRLAIYFNRMIVRLQDLQSGLEKIVEDRTAQLKAINEVGRVATSILDPDELINRVVHLITEEFGYYYAAIFLIDPSNKWAELKDATGEAGRVLKESQHRRELDGTNVIGRTIQSRQAQIMTDTGDKAFHFDYPLLPYTRSEISLPLYVSDRILGVLDVHSTKESAFSEQDIETLQNMANQVAISLDNAHLFQETRQNLHEMRSIQKQYLREAWLDTSVPSNDISLVAGKSSDGDIKNLVEVPVVLRDQIIGQLSLESDETLSLDEKNWIQEIATQTALALENARLVEESQSAAMREKFVTEITNKIWASMSIDGVLQTAVRELGQILDATEATIEIDVTGE
jgi:GAF domain-containing protein/HAMP domain-containing protein